MEYYRLVNEFVGDRLGGLHSARRVLVSVDFAEIERLQATGAWDKAAAVLARAAQQAEAVLAAGLTTVGLLDTAFTMEQAFYRDRLASHGLTFLVPDRQDRAAVHAIIYDELGQGIVLDASRDRYREAIARLTAAGAEGVVLGCTEIRATGHPGRQPRAGVPDDPAACPSRRRASARTGCHKAVRVSGDPSARASSTR